MILKSSQLQGGLPIRSDLLINRRVQEEASTQMPKSTMLICNYYLYVTSHTCHISVNYFFDVS